MVAKNTICLWYDGAARDAAQFYARTFPDSAVTAVHRAPGDYPAGRLGDVLTVEFTVAGIPCLGLNGGPVDSDDVRGYVRGDLVSFLVRWPDAAITAWVGRHSVDAAGDESIDTLWQMTMMNSDGAGGYWHSVMAGADHFTR